MSSSATRVLPADVGAEYTRFPPFRALPVERHSACHGNIDEIPFFSYCLTTDSGNPQDRISSFSWLDKYETLASDVVEFVGCRDLDLSLTFVDKTGVEEKMSLSSLFSLLAISSAIKMSSRVTILLAVFEGTHSFDDLSPVFETTLGIFGLTEPLDRTGRLPRNLVELDFFITALSLNQAISIFDIVTHKIISDSGFDFFQFDKSSRGKICFCFYQTRYILF